MNKIVASVGNDVELARARARTLRAKLDALEAASTKTEKARVQLRELEREAESNRVLLETFLRRFKETTSRQDLQQADARIISPADPPTEASFPNTKLTLAVTVVLSLMVGLGLAFLLEVLDHGYRTLDHVQKETRLKGLGMVPRLSRGNLRGNAVIESVLHSPTSAYAESLRLVQTTLTFGQVPAPKSIVVTSSVPGEGKTTFCVSLARLLARAGNTRVLFVEADLRRGDMRRQMSRRFHGPETLDAYLLGTVETWQDCVMTDKASNMDIIVGSGQCENAQALLQSDRMATLVREARERYDLILFDSPPITQPDVWTFGLGRAVPVFP